MTVSKQAPGSPLAVTSNTVRDVCGPDWYWHHTKMTVIWTTCSAVLHKGYCVCRCACAIQRLLLASFLWLCWENKCMLKQIAWRFSFLSQCRVDSIWSHAVLHRSVCLSPSCFHHTPFFSRRFMSMSFSTLCGSWSQSCMRTKGSLPFRLSLCQGLGLASRSETEPWVRPRIVSPNRRWPG